MANQTIRSAVFRVGSKKIGECHAAELSVSSGDEPAFGADGVQGYSQGATQSKVSAKTFIPVGGMKKDLTALVLKKTRVQITYFAGGIEYQIDAAAAIQFSISSETKSGMLEGTFEFGGGAPTAI